MAEKKRRKRRAYLDSFQKDGNGNYVYEGDMYIFESQGKELRQELMQLWGLTLAMMIALITAGCITAPGTGNCFYVLMPYMINVVAGISLCWGLGRMTLGGSELRSYVYEATVEQLPVRSGFTIVCAGAALLGELIYIIQNGTEGNAVGCVLFFILEAFVCGLTVLIKRQSKKIKWKKISHKTQDM